MPMLQCCCIPISHGVTFAWQKVFREKCLDLNYRSSLGQNQFYSSILDKPLLRNGKTEEAPVIPPL